MSLTPFELALNEPTIVIVPWYDDVVDPIGYDPRSSYVETFWLNVLGPTATWLMRRMVTGLDEYPGGYELDLGQTASALGLTFTIGASNPFARSLNRCVLFGAAQPIAGGLAVRRRLPPVANRHLQRMPPYLREAHEGWSRRQISSSDELARARGLAEAMVRVGDPIDAVERQLLGLGVPPNAAVEVTAAMQH
ncbi:MAG: hypothetical protein JWN99_1460, partial [Ilumatobacteraceae bacterium]|nr:hypothetical protein [Ilumatobacteraceae bacterium]